ncbi:hypothetical protein MJT46_003064 [Ovis ammon polii x Ovis aries]|nr:hypothetical protein MJT46_003064 [Ovis ammon polii x Ovis aries]
MSETLAPVRSYPQLRSGTVYGPDLQSRPLEVRLKTVPQDSTAMAKIKVQDLCGKKKEELLKQLGDLKVEVSQLPVAEVTGGMASKLSKI